MVQRAGNCLAQFSKPVWARMLLQSSCLVVFTWCHADIRCFSFWTFSSFSRLRSMQPANQALMVSKRAVGETWLLALYCQPSSFSLEFSIFGGITPFIWPHRKCFVLLALLCVLVLEFNFCGTEFFTKQTFQKVKVFFSEYAIAFWDVQNLVKYLTLCVNCFSALLKPFLKGLCLRSVSWPRKTHKSEWSRWWEPTTRVQVFN